MLEQILSDITPPPDREGRILHGFSNNEDAVLVKAPPAGLALVQTVDILGPIGNDARLFGQTAAANALSDIYAMGGWPWSVMNIAAFPSPSASSDTPLSVLTDILSGAMEKVAEAGAVLAGGHTLDDEWIKFGLSVTGVIDPSHAARNNGLVPGDVLILTKPLGTGVLATAIKAKWPDSDRAERDMYHWTTRLNAHASSLIRDMNLRAATDITGFGLGGHVLEMAEGSGVSVELDTSSLPLIDQVEDFASCGLIPAGTYRNRDYCSCRTLKADSADELRATLVFDAQTSGGLLLAVPAERRQEACERLEALGEPAFCVGRVLPPREDREKLILV